MAAASKRCCFKVSMFSFFLAEMVMCFAFMGLKSCLFLLDWVGVERSDLLNTRMVSLFFRWGVMMDASSLRCVGVEVRSMIHRMIVAWWSFWYVRSMPRVSIVSVVSRMPAVSMNRKVMPERLMVSSIMSRVVPCMGDTMARSSPIRRLRRVDFPAFVSPMMATGIPFLMALPTLNESARCFMCCLIWVANCFRLARLANSTSSSLKSSSSSIRVVKWRSCERRLLSLLLKLPFIWFSASLCMPAEVEAIRSATASAWLRSILPLRKARWVNSPGVARRAPWFMRSWSICCWM